MPKGQMHPLDDTHLIHPQARYTPARRSSKSAGQMSPTQGLTLGPPVHNLLLSLPDDLQSMIYAKLPLQDLYKLRTCCFDLCGIVDRDAFKHARAVEPCDLAKSYSPMFFSVGHDGRLEWAGYDLTSGEWSTLPSLKRLPSPDPGLLKQFLIAGGDGLLCVNVAKASEPPKLVIYNPLTQKMKELPAMNLPRHPVLMHLLVDRCKNSYKVIVAGSSITGTEHLSRKTEVYCSQTQSWQVTGDLPGPDFGLNEYQNGAYCDGMLYCVTLTDDCNGKVVLAYHVKKGKWLTNWYCPIPSFRSHAYFATTQIMSLGRSIFVFSEQEYLKDVKFCIARLEFIEMGMGSHKKKIYMEQPSYKWYNNNNIKCSKPQMVQELLLQSDSRKFAGGSSSGPAIAATEINVISNKDEENSWSKRMNNDESEKGLELWHEILSEKKVGKWEIVLQETKKGSLGLLVYPENTCVAQETSEENNLCIFNTVERTMIIYDFQNNYNNNNTNDEDDDNNNNTLSSHPIHNPMKLRENLKKFHCLNPLGFAFKPNFNASV